MAFARDDGVGGLVKYGEQGPDRRAIRVAELDQQVDVGNRHVGLAREPVQGFERTAGGDHEVEPFVLEVASVDGEKEGCRRPVDLAVEKKKRIELCARRRAETAIYFTSTARSTGRRHPSFSPSTEATSRTKGSTSSSISPPAVRSKP